MSYRKRRHRNPRRRRGGFSILSLLVPAGMVGAAYLLYQAVSNGTGSVAAIPGEIADQFSSALTSVTGAVSGEASSLEENISDIYSGIASGVGDEVTAVENGINSAWQSLKSAL